MEGLPDNSPQQAKKASKLVTRVAALIGIASATASPALRAQAPLTPELQRVNLTRVARPEDIDEIALKNKVEFTISEASSTAQADKKQET